LTILVSWPKGYVRPPTLAMKISYFIEDNHAAIYVLLCLALIVGYYWVSWYFVGRDPKKGTIIPLFHPPQNLSPAAVRYVWKMGYDDQVFSTAVINLAVKGYLKIEETMPFGIPNPFNLGKAYLLRRTRVF
jgi:hypothetical protein